MCGRFTLTTADYQTVARSFGAAFEPDAMPSYRPRYNAAPQDPCLIVTLESLASSGPPSRSLGVATWGFPIASSGDTQGMINARSETVHQKPTFADAFWAGRCGVAADGFFEWTGPRGDRRPLWFHRQDGHPFLMAGIFRDVPRADGRPKRRFAILTTEANGAVSPHHDRMPVILPPGRVDEWLRPPPSRDPSGIARARSLFAPAPDDWLVMTPVSRRVSDIRNDDPQCLEEVPLDSDQRTLF